jgi:hypothetical protein
LVIGNELIWANKGILAEFKQMEEESGCIEHAISFGSKIIHDRMQDLSIGVQICPVY